MSDFFRPQRGKNENAGTIALAIWIAFVAVFIVAYYVSKLFDSFLGDLPWQSLMVSFSASIPVLILTLCAPLIYGRPIPSLLTVASRFRFRLLGIGVAVWGSLLVIGTLIGVAFAPDDLKWNFNAGAFVPMALVCIVMVPIQVASEELLYRGLLAQAFGRAFRSNTMVIILATAIFALPHLLNPEAQAQPLLAFVTYSAISFAWVVAAHKWGGLEITLGAHLINNVFGILIVGYSNSVVATAPIWLGPAPDMAMTAISSGVTCLVWFGVLNQIARWRPALLSA